jgi:hypothetical protein
VFGVLVVILRPDHIAGLGLGLGHGEIPLIASLRVLRALRLGPRAARGRPPRAASKCRRFGLARIHHCVWPFCMAHSLAMAGESAPCGTRRARESEVERIPPDLICILVGWARPIRAFTPAFADYGGEPLHTSPGHALVANAARPCSWPTCTIPRGDNVPEEMLTFSGPVRFSFRDAAGRLHAIFMNKSCTIWELPERLSSAAHVRMVLGGSAVVTPPPARSGRGTEGFAGVDLGVHLMLEAQHGESSSVTWF